MLPGIFIFLVTGKRFPSKVIRSTEYLWCWLQKFQNLTLKGKHVIVYPPHPTYEYNLSIVVILFLYTVDTLLATTLISNQL